MKKKSEDLNIQIQYKLIEELTKTNENLQLKIKNEQKIGDELKSSINQLHLVNEFALLIQKATNTNEIVWSITENAVSKLDFEDCVIYLLDIKEEYLIQMAAHGHKNPKPREILNPIKIKIGDGIVGTVAKTGISEIIHNTNDDKRYIMDDIHRLSEITVPIIHKNKIIGIIDSEHRKANFFTDNHLEILTTIAAMAGTKIIQTQLNENLIKHQKNLEQIIEKRTSEIDQKNKDLETKNNLLNKLALFPAHNPNPVIELDMEFNVTYHNDACEKYTEIFSLIKGGHYQFEKFKKLFLHTIANKKSGKYTIKEGFRTDNYHFGYNIYIDREHNFVRVYLSDVTKIIHLQEEITKQRDEIYDSLNYAKIIQGSILPDSTFFNDFFDSHFVYFQPKDIVSGDFYWSSIKNDEIYCCLCDCTGHGVPGSLLSMIGYNALNSVINMKHVTSCVDFINELHNYFINAKKNKRILSEDTMDMILIKFNVKTLKLTFCGSKQKLILIKNHEMIEYNTDYFTIGDAQHTVDLTEKEILLEKGDKIYIFTDGYIDQFGGSRGKKFKLSNFRQLIESINNMEMSKQNETIENNMESWMTENQVYPQIDDMSIMGFKV